MLAGPQQTQHPERHQDAGGKIRYNSIEKVIRRTDEHSSALGGFVREDIRLGNEALERHDLDTARHYFQQVLDTAEATDLQKRIAANRLRDIAERQRAAEEPPVPASGKPRVRRKTSAVKQEEDSPGHRFVRPPEKPVVVINRH